jgi:hypothetical protein
MMPDIKPQIQFQSEMERGQIESAGDITYHKSQIWMGVKRFWD